MDQIVLFKTILGEVFRLKSPVLLVKRKKITWPGNIDCYGLYTGEELGNGKHKHKIEYYYCTDSETIFTTLAHEYVHAWQMENNMELEHDNPAWIMWEKHFREWWGIELQFA